MLFTENNGQQMWSKMLTEKFNVTDQYQLNWVSEYAAFHEIHESSLGLGGAASIASPIPSNGVGPMYSTPLNTTGMGNPMAPGAGAAVPQGGSAEFFKQAVGSGDIPVSTLPMSLNIALLTVGLELLPVQNAKGPWALLSYMDFPYAGGKLGRGNEVTGLDGRGVGAENKPLYFKVIVATADIAACRAAFAEGYTITFTNNTSGTKVATGKFKDMGRMDGGIICQVVSVLDGSTPISLKEVFTGSDSITIAITDPTGKSAPTLSNDKLSVDFAQTMVDFIPGFANFATGEARPMTRAENETGTGNAIGLRLFSKWIQMGSYEVTASVTRQQLQDLPLYGVDAVAKVMEACQDQITQHINWDICQHVRALGVTNAVQQKARYGFDANLWMGKKETTLADLANAPMKDIYDVDHATSSWVVENAEVNTSAENLHTRQRRIASRCLAAANQIAVTGRRGRGNWILTNAQVLSALQDCSGFVVAPFANNLDQTGSQNLFFGGMLNGLKIYVDPYMDWEDTRITVGRKGKVDEPGAIFMPYILADTVSITAEGTMAPKVLVNSRYTIADAGFYPETQYLTFCVGSEFGII